MIVEIKFLSISEVPHKLMSIDLGPKSSVLFSEVLDLVLRDTGIEFVKRSENYMFMLNSSIVAAGNFNSCRVYDADRITIMPMICGG